MKTLSKIILATCLFVVSSANASLMLSISDGSNTETVTDTDNDGVVFYNSLLDGTPTLNWSFNGAVGLGNDFIGSPTSIWTKS